MKILKSILLLLVLVLLITSMFFLSKRFLVFNKTCDILIKDEASSYDIAIENKRNFRTFVSPYINCSNEGYFLVGAYPTQQVVSTSESIEIVFTDGVFPGSSRVNSMKVKGSDNTEVVVMKWQFEVTQPKTSIYIWFADDILTSPTIEQELPFYIAAKLSFLTNFNNPQGQLDRLSTPEQANFSLGQAGLKYDLSF